jgi:predicted HTH transcriptional regulator
MQFLINFLLKIRHILIDTQRFIDEPPQSRNEALASFMRRINICEERGSGIDKVIFQVEFFQLPAPQFRVIADSLDKEMISSLVFLKPSFSACSTSQKQNQGLKWYC